MLRLPLLPDLHDDQTTSFITKSHSMVLFLGSETAVRLEDNSKIYE